MAWCVPACVWVWWQSPQVFLFVILFVPFQLVFFLSQIRKVPSSRIEIDEEQLILEPEGHWGQEPIPLNSIVAKRSEALSQTLIYDRDGGQKVFQMSRWDFTHSQWRTLAQFVRGLPVMEIG